MRLTHASLLTLLVLAPTLAKADDINTYNVQATLSNESGSSVSGTVTIDSTTGVITGENLTYVTSDDGIFVFNQTDPSQSEAFTGSGDFTYATLTDATASSFFEINDASLVGYAGGGLCTLDTPCPGSNASNLFEPNGNIPNFQTGSITAANVAPSPEPSSFVLLGTGLLAAAGAARRRFTMA